MALEEITYDQQVGGPDDPLGIRKQLNKGKGTDPLGLRAQLNTSNKPLQKQPPVFEIKITEPTFKSSPANVSNREFTYNTKTPTHSINKLHAEASQAKSRLSNELKSNDTQYEKIIREYRRDSYTIDNLRNDYKQKGYILPPQDEQKILNAEKQKQYDLPVTPLDISDFKTGTLLTESEAIKFIKRLNRKDLNSDAYKVNKYNELSNDPLANERVEKINQNAKKIEQGNLLYDPETNQLLKPVGLLGSFVEGWRQKSKLFADYDFLKNTENDAAIVMELDDRMKNTDEAIVVPKSKLSEVSQMVGGLPLKPLIGGAVASVAGPQAAMTAGAVIGGREFAKMEYAANFQQIYYDLRNKGVDKYEAVAQARRQAEQAAEIGAVMGGAMGLVGGRLSAKPMPQFNFSGSFRQAALNVLKQSGHELGKAAKEGAVIGGIGAAGQVYKNKLAQSIGIDRPLDEGVLEQIEGGLLMTVAMAAAIKGGRGITKANYRSLLHGLSKAPEEQINAAIQEKVHNGEITQKAADETLNRINEYKGLDKLIPETVSEEARHKIQYEILRRKRLEGEMETLDKSYHPEIKEKIKSIDEKILQLTKENKVEPEKIESGLTKEQEKEATEIAEEWLQEGILPDTFEEMIKKDPIGFWKTIAQQAQNRDANWKPLSEKLSEQAVRDQFGDTVVDYAKELFPAPEIKESSISVIRPEEIQRPDTITIAPKPKEEKVLGEPIVTKVETGDLYEFESPLGKVAGVQVSPTEFRIDGISAREVGKGHGSQLFEGLINYLKDKGVTTLTTESAGEGAQRMHQKAIEKGLITEVSKDGANATFTINDVKPQEDAISIGSPEATNVGEAPGYSPAMGEGVPKSRETTIPQEGGIQETGGGSGQEGVGQVSIHFERPPTQLSFRGLQDTANEFGYDDVVSRTRVSDIQERRNAEITANEWAERGEYQRNIDDLLNKIENKELVPTAKQRLILEQYLANEKQALRDLPRSSDEFNRQLEKVRRIKEVGQIARQEAGAALRIPNSGSMPHPINDVADAMVAKMEANSVDRLTDQQKAEVEAQVEKYKKAADDANEKTAKLEEQISKLEAEKEFKKVKSTTKRQKKTTEERVAYRKSEIDAAREALKRLRSGESGLSAVPLPGVRELMAIAPHVKNIMVDLVAQGVDNLQDVISHLHNEFKEVLEGITEKNIHDIIAGEYNEKREPLSELQRQVRDIQDEAKYINQLESLLSGKEPKNERSKIERNRKIKELQDKIKELRKQKSAEEKEATDFYGEEFDADRSKLIQIKKRNEKRAAEIKEKISKGEFEKETKKSIFDREDIKKNYPRLRKDALDAIAKKEDAQHEFDLALFNDEIAKRSKIQKAASFAGKLVHTGKALMAGIDDSATFVQNGLAMLANPKLGAKVWIKHWKEAFNEKEFKREIAAIHARPDWEIIKNSGLDIVEPHTAASKQVEEAFEKNLLAGKIKIRGEEYQPWKYTGGIFERAFTSMGNNFRINLFEKRMEMLKADKKTFESHPEEYKDAARAINELTGRGKLPQGLAQASPYITPFIWAPRLLTSTINTLGLSDLVLGVAGKGYYQNLTPAQRNFALGQLGRGVAMGVAVMGAAALAGAEIDYDPRSVTFGDIKFGDHHYNVFGRYTPVVKTLVQAVGGSRVKGTSVQDLDNPRYGGKTRIGVVGGFFRGKMTPFAGAMYDLSEHKNYFTQEPFGVEDLPKALLTPLSVKELKEGWQNDGTWTILNRFLPAFEGIKVSDERDFSKGGGSGGGAGATGTVKAKPTKTHKINPRKD